jgi:hypothetical protein
MCGALPTYDYNRRHIPFLEKKLGMKKTGWRLKKVGMICACSDCFQAQISQKNTSHPKL